MGGSGRVGLGGGGTGGREGGWKRKGRREPERYAGRAGFPGRRAGLALRVYIPHTCMRRLVFARCSSLRKGGGYTVL